jgi:hypothetical protein
LEAINSLRVGVSTLFLRDDVRQQEVVVAADRVQRLLEDD